MMEELLQFNIVIYRVSFPVFLLPAFVLLLVSLVAILLSKKIHWKMRTLMLYVMVPNVLKSLNQTVVGLSPNLYFQDIELPI